MVAAFKMYLKVYIFIFFTNILQKQRKCNIKEKLLYDACTR